MPEAQLRCTVSRGTGSGTPARSAVIRAMFAASAGWAQFPRITWSRRAGIDLLAGEQLGHRDRAPARRRGVCETRPPALTNGVRTPSRIQIWWVIVDQRSCSGVESDSSKQLRPRVIARAEAIPGPGIVQARPIHAPGRPRLRRRRSGTNVGDHPTDDAGSARAAHSPRDRTRTQEHDVFDADRHLPTTPWPRYRKPAMFMRKTAGGWEPISVRPGARRRREPRRSRCADLGIRAGDRVAILSENRYEWPSPTSPCSASAPSRFRSTPRSPPPQVRFILENSEARLAIVSTAGAARQGARRDGVLPQLEPVVAHRRAAGRRTPTSLEPDDRCSSAARRARARAPRRSASGAERIGPDDLATIIYTSGTTGEPKGAMLTHGNIASNVDGVLSRCSISTPTDTCLSFLPLCHIFERMAGLYAMLRRGVTIAYAREHRHGRAPMPSRCARPC